MGGSNCCEAGIGMEIVLVQSRTGKRLTLLRSSYRYGDRTGTVSYWEEAHIAVKLVSVWRSYWYSLVRVKGSHWYEARINMKLSLV